MAAARAWSVLAILLVGALALSGCVKKDTSTPTPTTSTPSDATPTGGSTPPTGGTNTTPPPRPNPDPITDKGSIQGPFEKSWNVNVPVIAPRAVTILFNLTGAQAGAPPTAQVYLTLNDPNGKTIKSATLGLGGDPAAKWTLGAEITSTGNYVLKATAQPPPGPLPAGLPSGGLANYDLYAKVDY